MSPGATFERVYLAIRDQVMAGDFGAGAHLEPTMLADQLDASITPVRDALHRLVGERLVDALRNDGFRIPFHTEASLCALYGWNNQLLQLAIARRGESSDLPGRVDDQLEADQLVRATASLFAALASWSGNAEHLAAVENLSARLSPLRRLERAILPDVAAELAALEAAARSADAGPNLRKLVAAYHRRRRKAAGPIIAAFHG